MRCLSQHLIKSLVPILSSMSGAMATPIAMAFFFQIPVVHPVSNITCGMALPGLYANWHNHVDVEVYRPLCVRFDNTRTHTVL